MANRQHLKILKQGVERWNEWREENPEVRPDLAKADLGEANLSGASLWQAKLTEANLIGANLHGAELDGSDLSYARLDGADLREADLGGAYVRDADLHGANLSEADLRSADFNGAKLFAANLSRANLSGANLGGADLSDADLRNAGLSGAELGVANLTGTDLTGADLSGAALWSTNLSGARLRFASFTGANASGTNFTDVDLSSAKGLETIEHAGPSSVGIDTIYKSRGKIPEAFLRGCGVPDEFIAYIGSMVGRPIEFYSCFISYSSKDQEFAERIHADLQAKGVRCWYAPEEMKGGRKLHEQIDEAIRLHDKLLLILSEHSMSSHWVKTEIANAREREEREGKQLLFPITLVPFEAIKQWKLFDADIGIDSGREIREYFIPDFSNWKEHDSYQTAFQRLVKDLKAGSAAG
jgi:uncharacterized protein YjbI with pentapeptide repeats